MRRVYSGIRAAGQSRQRRRPHHPSVLEQAHGSPYGRSELHSPTKLARIGYDDAMLPRTSAIIVLLAVASCSDAPSGSPTPSSSDTADAATVSTTHPEPSTGLDTTAAPPTGTGPVPGSSSGFLTTGESTGGPGMLGVYARYEVRDNTGTPQEIWASPVCTFGFNDCYTSDFGQLVPECMLVQAVGQDRIGIAYQLATGNPIPCYQEYASWAESPNYIYFDAACTQPAIFPGSVSNIAGVLYYGSFDTSVVPINLYYDYEGIGCTLAPNTYNYRYSNPIPVPGSILDILPDAPYEIVIAY